MNLKIVGPSKISTSDFLLSKESLLARRNAKWTQYAPDVIPAYVADMDFRVAPQIEAAIRRSVDAADYGYPMRNSKPADRSVAEAFARRMKRLYGWDARSDLTTVLSDLVQATFASVTAYSEPGDGVIVQAPNYPPFKKAVEETGRRLVPLGTIAGEKYAFDLETLDAMMTPDVKVFILCNPQNPTGRVFSRAELEAVLSFAEKHDLIVVADEIHSDLIYGAHRHIPFATLGPAALARTVTLNSATKSFNIPGLRCAVMHFGTPELKARFDERFPGHLLGSVNSLGLDATVAAWDEADDWLSAVLTHLEAMRDRMVARVSAELPEIRFIAPEATYLAWLDCTAFGIEGSMFDFFHEKARVAFSPGENFTPGGKSYVRLNFATSAEILDEIIDRMVRAVRSNSKA